VLAIMSCFYILSFALKEVCVEICMLFEHRLNDNLGDNYKFKKK